MCIRDRYWGADYQIRAEEDLGKVHALSRALLADASSSAWRLLEAPAEEPPALRLRVPASAKPANILKILARYAAGEPVLRSFSVLRERSWATGASGEPLPYFELPF